VTWIYPNQRDADHFAVLNLAAVGAVKIAWRDSPVEDWQADPESLIKDSDMMQANAATTRLVRDHLHRQHSAAGDGLLRSASRLPGSEPVELFSEICTMIADLHRRLPNGLTLPELAPDNDVVDEFVEHVQACGLLWSVWDSESRPPTLSSGFTRPIRTR
jgi:hypothetical protein